MNVRSWIYYHLFLLMIVLANVTIAAFGAAKLGPLIIPWGVFFAGATFVLRDLIQLHADRYAVISAIILGAVISYSFSNPALAIASGTAFLIAESSDFIIFVRIRKKYTLSSAVLASGAAGAMIDTAVFLPWSGIPMTLGLVAGQVIVKFMLSALAALGIKHYFRSTPTSMHKFSVDAQELKRTSDPLSSRHTSS
jgi:uncharacterized PurR-regulated membrane protein YhhQ (DUF165 family)